MIALEQHPAGVILPVRAQPGSKAAGIRGEQNGSLKVAVTQIAEKGKANKAVLETLARGLGLRHSQFELIAGPTSADKRFLVRGVSVEELRAAIAAAMPE